MTPLIVNGQTVTPEVDADTPLLWVLRADLGLTGTKYACGMALCGSCTVHANGTPIRACVTPVSAVGGQAITTIEGLNDRIADALRAAWTEIDVVQCGYCQSGQLMSAWALLQNNPTPDDTAIDQALSGNLCRCGTYPRIRAAIHRAAQRLRGA